MPARFLALVCTLMVALPAFGQSENRQPNHTPVAYDNTALQPSTDLLEFLGEWETADGEWIDPSLLDEMPLPEGESSDE